MRAGDKSGHHFETLRRDSEACVRARLSNADGIRLADAGPHAVQKARVSSLRVRERELFPTSTKVLVISSRGDDGYPDHTKERSMGLIQFVKDVGRRLPVGDTPPAQSAQTPVARPGSDPQKAAALVRLVKQQAYYGDATQHLQIFKANRPLLRTRTRSIRGRRSAPLNKCKVGVAGSSLHAKRVAHLADDVTGERRRHPSGDVAD
jgi:hypothetical protein